MSCSRFKSLVLAAILISCTHEIAETPFVMHAPVLTAQRDGYTRTATDNVDFSVNWTDGDNLSVFVAPGGSGQWSENLEYTIDDPEAGRFVPASDGVVNFTEGVQYDWKAVYPYTAALSSEELSQIPLQQVQEGKNSTAHLALYDIMYGSANSTSTPSILMRHTGTLLKWTVQNDSELPFNVNSISFFNGADTYVLTVSGNPEIAPSYSADFYMVARPFDFAAGEELRISVVTSAGTETQIKKFPAAKSFRAGQYNTATIICTPSQSPTRFNVSKDEAGKWRLYKNYEVFFINGAAANNYYDHVAEFGGNAIRTYSSSQIDEAISAAESTGTFILVGLPVGRERDGFDFDNTAAVNAQRENIKAIVSQYYKSPAIMGWILGNELDSNYSDARVWEIVEDLTKTVKTIDPYHVVTTALAGAKKNAVTEIISMAPSLDFLSFNSYYPSTGNLKSNLSSYGWSKPWAITEFGPRGTWNLSSKTEPPQTEWGACVEQTSSQKASIYRDILAQDVKGNKDSGCIGSFAFVWGYQTHGDVLTWYSLFDEKGYAYAAVEELQYAWTGSYPSTLAPVISDRKSLLVDGALTADDNIRLSPGSSHTASVSASSPSGAPLSYKWVIVTEGSNSLAGIGGLISNNSLSNISFKAPGAGEYRLIVFVYDDANKKVASGAIPFKVADSGVGTDPEGWSAGHQNW